MDEVEHHLFDHIYFEIFSFESVPWLGEVVFYFSKHVFVLVLSMLVTAGLIIWTYRQYGGNGSLIPTGRIAQLIEAFVVYVRDNMVYRIMDEEEAERFLPFILTLFLLLLVSNFLGLLPEIPFPWSEEYSIYPAAAATGNFSVNLALASAVLFAGMADGIRKMGFFGYLANFLPHGMPWYIVLVVGPILWPIEVIGTLIKHAVLAIRLLANMFAGHAVLFSILFLAVQNVQYAESFLGGFATALGPIVLGFVVYLLEWLVAIIQAYVFTILSVIFLDMQISGH